MVEDNVRVRLIFESIAKESASFGRMQHNVAQIRKQFGTMSKEMKRATKPMIQNALQTEELRGKYDSFAGVMAMSQTEFRKFNENGGKFLSRGARFGNTLRRLTHGLRGFRMEMLGVMFFGMGMTRWFTGLIKPAMQLAGIFELWTTTLQILFLPLAIWLLESFLLPFMQWVLSLSEETKLLIGKFVLFGAALGAALMIIGMFALGIGSIIMAFGGLLLIIDKLIPDIDVLGINVSSFLETLAGIGIAVVAWKALKGIISGLLERFFELSIVKELMERLGFTLDTQSSAWDNFKMLVGNVIDTVKDKLSLKGFNMSNFDKKLAELKIRFDWWVMGVRQELAKMGLDELGESLKKIASLIDEEMVNAITNLATELVPLLTRINKFLDILIKIKEKYDEFKGTALGRLFTTAVSSAMELLPPNSVVMSQYSPIRPVIENIIVNIEADETDISRAIADEVAREVDSVFRQVQPTGS